MMCDTLSLRSILVSQKGTTVFHQSRQQVIKLLYTHHMEGATGLQVDLVRCLEKFIFDSQVLSDVRLVEHHDRRWVQIFTEFCGLRCKAKTQRYIGHAVHYNTPILGRFLRYSSQSRLLHMISVEEGHLGARLHPHLVLYGTGHASGGERLVARISSMSSFP